MVDVKTVSNAVNEIAPYDLAETWDNVGVTLDCGNKTDCVLVALDATPETLAEAQRRGCGILLTHHPALIQPQNTFDRHDIVILAARMGISLIAAHTNFDKTIGGVNDVLALLLGLQHVRAIADGLARGGTIEPMSCKDFVLYVKQRLGRSVLGIVATDAPIQNVAVLGGSGGSQIHAIADLGYDALVTGEVKHHDALAARSAGMCLVTAGHFATENPSMKLLCSSVGNKLGDAATCMLSEDGADPMIIF